MISVVTITNYFETVTDDSCLPPPDFKYIDIYDILELETFEAVYMRNVFKDHNKWARKRGVTKSEDGTLIIPAESINKRLINKRSLAYATSDSNMVLWFKVSLSHGVLSKALCQSGMKRLISSSKEILLKGFDDKLLRDFTFWGIQEAFFIGFQSDMDWLDIVGNVRSVKSLYDKLPNKQDDATRLYFRF